MVVLGTHSISTRLQPLQHEAAHLQHMVLLHNLRRRGIPNTASSAITPVGLLPGSLLLLLLTSRLAGTTPATPTSVSPGRNNGGTQLRPSWRRTPALIVVAETSAYGSNVLPLLIFCFLGIALVPAGAGIHNLHHAARATGGRG